MVYITNSCAGFGVLTKVDDLLLSAPTQWYFFNNNHLVVLQFFGLFVPCECLKSFLCVWVFTYARRGQRSAVGIVLQSHPLWLVFVCDSLSL